MGPAHVAGLNRKQRKELARRLRVEDPDLEVMHPHAAGIDVGNSAHYVAVRPDRDPDSVRRFECFTADLHRLADWLVHCGVTTVAMQSTGVVVVIALGVCRYVRMLFSGGLSTVGRDRHHAVPLRDIASHSDRLTKKPGDLGVVVGG
jgi:hypothetical protein